MTDAPLPKRSAALQQQLRDLGVVTAVRAMPDSTRTAADAAASLACDVGAIASSLVFRADGVPLLVMTSGAHRVDTDALARRLGVGAITQAQANEVREITGQPIGGVAPIGHPQQVRTVVDESLRDYDVVWAAAGTPHTVMALSFDELVQITGGSVCSVTSEQ